MYMGNMALKCLCFKEATTEKLWWVCRNKQKLHGFYWN